MITLMDDVDYFKVIVAGSRNFYDYEFLKQRLDHLFSKINKPILIVSGGAKGADSLGERYSREVLGREPKIFPAPWKDIDGKPEWQIGRNAYSSYWKLAGNFRNGQMKDFSDALVAFNVNNSSGTSDMIRQAKEKGLSVREYNIDK